VANNCVSEIQNRQLGLKIGGCSSETEVADWLRFQDFAAQKKIGKIQDYEKWWPN